MKDKTKGIGNILYFNLKQKVIFSACKKCMPMIEIKNIE